MNKYSKILFFTIIIIVTYSFSKASITLTNYTKKKIILEVYSSENIICSKATIVPLKSTLLKPGECFLIKICDTPLVFKFKYQKLKNYTEYLITIGITDNPLPYACCLIAKNGKFIKGTSLLLKKPVGN